MLTSFPDLEKQGSNLTVEALLRGIGFAAEERKVKSFRNIYVQLDNTGSNKNATLIVACALLVALGVCKKIKVNYLEVGHTHEDIDALIGSVVVKLRKMDLPTFQSRIDAILEALNEANASIKKVEEPIGITDYSSVMDSKFTYVSGIMPIKEFRIAANEEGIPIFLYKSNSTVDGWYPRPFERLDDFQAIRQVFQHPEPDQGFPLEVISVTPGSSSAAGEQGKRQHWFYKIRFAGGDVMTFPMKCIGIPITLPSNINEFVETLPAQTFNGPLKRSDKRDEVLDEIGKMLNSRNGTLNIIVCHFHYLIVYYMLR